MENKELYNKQTNQIVRHWFMDSEGNYYLNCDPYGVQVSGKVTVMPINMSNYEVRQSSQPINSGWVLCDDDMPEPLETVWISNGKGWTTLGCIVDFEEGYCWAELVNGLVYQEGDKIVAECEADDMDVVFWHRLPQPITELFGFSEQLKR